MSIWSSLDGPPIRARNGHTDAANYRAEGRPTITLDVATATSYHSQIRLGLWDDDNAIDECPLIEPDEAVALAHRLLDAVREVHYRRPRATTEGEP